jgi:flagellin
MASILTNTSAMVALQNLRSINSNLVDTQNQIATGKKIATAKDNAAIWAVSKVLESDVAGFKSISDSLNLGQSTLSVGRNAAETVSNLLTELRGNITAAQEENVDRSKIQADVESTVEQIKSIVDSARFNGLSLVEGFDDVNILGSLQRNADGSVSAKDITVGRYDLSTARGEFGTGTDDNFTIDETVFISQDNDSGTDVGLLRAAANTAVATLGTPADGDVFSVDIDGQRVSVTFDASVTDGSAATTNTELVDQLAQKINELEIEGVTAENDGSDGLQINNANAFEELDVALLIDGAADNSNFLFANDSLSDEDGQDFTAARTEVRLVGKSEKFEFAAGINVEQGDGFRLNIGNETFTYVAGPNESVQDVAKGLQAAIAGSGIEGLTTEVYFDEAETDDSVYWTAAGAASTIGKGDRYVLAINYDNTEDSTATIQIGDGTTFFESSSDGVASGGLFGLEGLDVSTDDGADRALTAIDTFIDNALDAASSFGSSERRVDLQSDFVGKLVDSLKTGIGALVDADLEAASARLQALQVQQQLGVQSLSIANQAPQSILSLFR